MAPKDDDLLARLNALKSTSIQFDTTFRFDAASPANNAEDPEDLAARFRKLHSGGTSRQASVEPENTPHNDEDDQTLEDLLKDLGPEDQWQLNPDEPTHIDALLAEAKAALPTEDSDKPVIKSEEQSERVGEAEEILPPPPFATFEARLRTDEAAEDDGTQDRQDEQDADAYIASVLAQLEDEKSVLGADDAEAREQQGDNTPAELDLPAAPTLEFPTTPRTEAAKDFDEALSARFASLGMGLPAAPSFSPSKKPVTVTGTVKKTRTKGLEKYTDEDIESWCCICNEDATIRCLGCDGDLYCTSCWKEGHGNGPGQERGHRAAEYKRDLGAAAA
ncbi:hypothetical protein ANO11243_040130 [Dothideomycetidae sp. 11243]|nr:hypothetical protein ANO11243_040130 [fungal sp. No.11243]